MEKVWSARRPITKKQVRSLLGLTDYYRNYTPNYATIAAPLTDLMKRCAPNQVISGDPQEIDFATLKQHLTSYPVLKLPDLTNRVVLQTETSDVGVGAVLMQEHEN